MLDTRTLAIINIAGSSLDVIGSLYLAYDLLGGEHGPLRTLTKGVTYGLIIGVGYGIVFGPLFGLATGVTTGITLAWELSRAARRKPRPGFWYETAMSAIRGFGFAVGLTYLFGARFGITFGILGTVGQAIVYRFGVRPSLDYAPSTRPGITRYQFLAVVNRAVGYAIAGYVSALVGHQQARALTFGLEVGLMIGVITAIVSFCMPFIEWAADHMPERLMGVIGVGLILTGFVLQSVQYWVTLLGAKIN
ncbi:MAG TPA: hypothetical protein VGZ48_11000 [Candidatus Acidoferrales bacterium]|jgi:hypothetical protein|nr:hypothetical protein [Candidatus Acidoferrales bacterium]